MSSNQLVEYLIKGYDKTRVAKCDFSEINLPIDKINGKKCSVQIYLRAQSIVLHITSCDVYDHNDDELRELYRGELISCYDYKDKDKRLNKDNFVMAIVNLKKTLTELKFDKFSGKFIKENDDKIIKEFASVLADIDNIKLTCDACCVCSVATKTTTPCNHSLCVECWDSIHIQDKNSLDEKIPCPICRENIMFIKDDE